jgi:AmiR/NasT family two-component response regulator
VVSEAALPSANGADVQDLLAVRAVIEQAKGIVMATYRCGPDDASDLLHKASQGLGVKVQVLAARLVELAAQGKKLRLRDPIVRRHALSRHRHARS